MRRSIFLCFYLICCFSSNAEIPEEDDVLVLSESNFHETIKSKWAILVEFYAPWCGHCKQLAPEYAAAARQLKAMDPPIPLAKVDATAETKLAEQYGVRGYPSLKLFIDGRDQEYTGGRTEQNIVTWILKKTGPPAIQLDDMIAAGQFLKDNRLAVLGIFGPEVSSDAYIAAARQLEDVMFAHSSTPEVVAALATQENLSPPAVKMFFPHDEKAAVFTGDLNSVSEIESFVKSHKQPAVSTFSGETAPEIFGDGRPILFIFRDGDENGMALENELRAIAPSFKRRLLVTVAGTSEPMEQRLMDYVGVEPEDFPTARIIASPMASMKKYKISGETTASAIVQFVSDYEAGKLRPHLRSEPPPDSQPGPVHTLVGSTFDSIVKNPNKDVLVEFYAPWCGHCKKLEPIYRDVARKLESVKSIVIAKIDATANDVEGVDVEGFPTIKFWRADKKDEPFDYDGDRDVESFVKWLEEKSALPFSREEAKVEL